MNTASFQTWYNSYFEHSGCPKENEIYKKKLNFLTCIKHTADTKLQEPLNLYKNQVMALFKLFDKTCETYLNNKFSHCSRIF